MATLNIGDYRFTVEPNTARWSYSMKINPIDTYGGRVVQLLSCKIDNLTIEGYIRPAKWNEINPGSMQFLQFQGMRIFESNVRSIMLYHETMRAPVRFLFQEVGWDGYVWLTGYSDVRYEPDIPAVKYVLKFDVDYGFDTVLSAIRSGDEINALDNIPNGVNWVRSVYNTPLSSNDAAVKKAIEDIVDDSGKFDASKPLDYYDYLSKAIKGQTEKGDDNSTQRDEQDDANADGNGGSPIVSGINNVLKQLGLVM